MAKDDAIRLQGSLGDSGRRGQSRSSLMSVDDGDSECIRGQVQTRRQPLCQFFVALVAINSLDRRNGFQIAKGPRSTNASGMEDEVNSVKILNEVSRQVVPRPVRISDDAHPQ